jgi:hypothetical protein
VRVAMLGVRVKPITKPRAGPSRANLNRLDIPHPAGRRFSRASAPWPRLRRCPRSWVTPAAFNQSRNASSSRVIVRRVRTSLVGRTPSASIRRQAITATLVNV